MKSTTPIEKAPSSSSWHSTRAMQQLVTLPMFLFFSLLIIGWLLYFILLPTDYKSAWARQSDVLLDVDDRLQNIERGSCKLMQASNVASGPAPAPAPKTVELPLIISPKGGSGTTEDLQKSLKSMRPVPFPVARLPLPSRGDSDNVTSSSPSDTPSQSAPPHSLPMPLLPPSQ